MLKIFVLLFILLIIFLIVKKAYKEFKKAEVSGMLDEVDITNAQFDTIKDVDVNELNKKKEKINKVTKK